MIKQYIKTITKKKDIIVIIAMLADLDHAQNGLELPQVWLRIPKISDTCKNFWVMLKMAHIESMNLLLYDQFIFK